MAGFTVDGVAVEAAATQLGHVVEELESAAVTTRAQLDRLLGGGWSGEAARAFGAGWHEWEKGFVAATSGLRGMSGALSRTAAVYGETEQQTAQHLASTGAPR